MTTDAAIDARGAVRAPHRILVVDDEEGLRQSLAANLELEGYEVVEAEDGRRAIELVRDRDFDLVITDIRMPGIDGLDTFRELRKIKPGIAVVMMTAFTLERLVADALSEGVYTVLTKPFDIARIIELIARVLAGCVVLVIDDSEEQAASMVHALRAVGLRAEAVHDGASAIRFVREAGVDVCVLDLVMPDMDGVQTYEEIRRLDGSIAVIAVSGHSVPEMMHRLMSLGGYTCLRKPFDMRELVRAIARARGDAMKGPVSDGQG
jgi:two-component system response regulator HydG